MENGQSVTRSRDVMRELTLAPEVAELSTDLAPKVRKRSIYEAVVYDARVSGKARFAFPPDLARTGVDPSQMDLSRAELRFGLSDPRGLGANPRVNVGASRSGCSRAVERRRTRLLRLGRRDRPADATIAGGLRLRLPRQCVAQPCPAGGRHALERPFVLAEPELYR